MRERDIHIDCGNARRKASLLREQANNLRSVVNSYKNVSGKIDAAWKGSSAQKFKKNLNNRISTLQKTVVKLEEIAAAIEQTANIYERNQISKIRAAARAAKSGAAGKGRS